MVVILIILFINTGTILGRVQSLQLSSQKVLWTAILVGVFAEYLFLLIRIIQIVIVFLNSRRKGKINPEKSKKKTSTNEFIIYLHEEVKTDTEMIRARFLKKIFRTDIPMFRGYEQRVIEGTDEEEKNESEKNSLDLKLNSNGKIKIFNLEESSPKKGYGILQGKRSKEFSDIDKSPKLKLETMLRKDKRQVKGHENHKKYSHHTLEEDIDIRRKKKPKMQVNEKKLKI